MPFIRKEANSTPPARRECVPWRSGICPLTTFVGQPPPVSFAGEVTTLNPESEQELTSAPEATSSWAPCPGRAGDVVRDAGLRLRRHARRRPGDRSLQGTGRRGGRQSLAGLWPPTPAG